MTGRRTILLAVLVGLLQVGFLGWMIQGRASILQSGREVLLRVKPVDPRDLLRGDYVVLAYDAAEVPASAIVNLPTDGTSGYGSAITVRLAKQADGFWMPAAAALDDGRVGPAVADQVDIRATVVDEMSNDAGARIMLVDYGIERFYVPEGDGLAIEKDMRVRPFGILAAVDDNGAPQIKGLMDGDQMLYAEPLY